jgi:hypothetical protein
MFSIYFSNYIFFGFKRERERERMIYPEILHLPFLHYIENTLNKIDNTYLFSICKK